MNRAYRRTICVGVRRILADSDQITTPHPPTDAPLAVIGVISDTHIPDRNRRLHPDIIPLLREAGVQRILHAGDICVPWVLELLEEIAPVTAVRGNRDWMLRKNLPLDCTLKIEGVKIGLSHGHGGLSGYVLDKLHYLRAGYQRERYQKSLRKLFPTAKVIVFGHTHRAENLWAGDYLLFNPGAAGSLSSPSLMKLPPSIGLLYIYPDATVAGKIIPLQ